MKKVNLQGRIILVFHSMMWYSEKFFYRILSFFSHRYKVKWIDMVLIETLLNDPETLRTVRIGSNEVPQEEVTEENNGDRDYKGISRLV